MRSRDPVCTRCIFPSDFRPASTPGSQPSQPSRCLAEFTRPCLGIISCEGAVSNSLLRCKPSSIRVIYRYICSHTLNLPLTNFIFVAILFVQLVQFAETETRFRNIYFLHLLALRVVYIYFIPCYRINVS